MSGLFHTSISSILLRIFHSRAQAFCLVITYCNASPQTFLANHLAQLNCLCRVSPNSHLAIDSAETRFDLSSLKRQKRCGGAIWLGGRKGKLTSLTISSLSQRRPSSSSGGFYLKQILATHPWLHLIRWGQICHEGANSRKYLFMHCFHLVQDPSIRLDLPRA